MSSPEPGGVWAWNRAGDNGAQKTCNAANTSPADTLESSEVFGPMYFPFLVFLVLWVASLVFHFPVLVSGIFLSAAVLFATAHLCYRDRLDLYS